MASIRCAAPYFAEREVGIDGEEYKWHLENNLSPATTPIILLYGEAKSFYILLYGRRLSLLYGHRGVRFSTLAICSCGEGRRVSWAICSGH